MRVLLLLSILLVAALVAAPPGSAADWYWNEAKAQSEVTRYANTGILNGGVDAYALASCYGQGVRWRRMYKRFVCRVNVFIIDPVATRAYGVRIAVTGKNTFRIISGNLLA